MLPGATALATEIAIWKLNETGISKSAIVNCAGGRVSQQGLHAVPDPGAAAPVRHTKVSGYADCVACDWIDGYEAMASKSACLDKPTRLLSDLLWLL